MKSVQKIDLGLTGYDELFMNDAERKENKLPRIYDIPLSEIDDFPDHPFKVKLDEDMDQLVQSIKERGIITPVTLRPKEDGRYEIVSGHRRRKACELAGFDTVKAEVREMTRDETIILMVESNLQRSVILPSEKAFSYKMRLEAMNRQGQRTDLTSVPVAQKSTSRELLGKEVGESQDQVRRYIRLTELIPELLDLVDEGRIAFRPAVELSYLQKEEQSALLEQIAYPLTPAATRFTGSTSIPMQMQADSMFPVILISLFLKSLSSSMTLPTIRKTPPTSEMTLKKCRISSLRTSILRSSWKLKMTMRWTAIISSSRQKTS